MSLKRPEFVRHCSFVSILLPDIRIVTHIEEKKQNQQGFEEKQGNSALFILYL
jgi:hypothetical protein